MSPHLSQETKALLHAAEAMTAEVRRIADALTTPTTDPEDEWTGPLIPPILTDAIRAEQAEAGRVAADNMLRAVCAVFGGPHQDPVVKARETLARAERAEAAIEGVRGLATRLEEFAENALKTDDRKLYAAIARDLRTQLGDAATGLAQAEATEPGPATLREQIAQALLDHLSRTADIRPGRDGEMAFMPEVTDSERLHMADAVLAVILPTTKLLGDLHRSAHEDLQRVTALYERWMKSPMLLGVTDVYRWWDDRLAELHAAIDLPEQAEDPT